MEIVASSVKETYTGPERRIRQRRQQVDRRVEIRFELDKTPRRSGRDRRVATQSVWDGRNF